TGWRRATRTPPTCSSWPNSLRERFVTVAMMCDHRGHPEEGTFMYQGNIAVPEQLRTIEDAECLIESGECPIPPREILDRIAGKWAILITVSTARAPRRFTELERLIEGISR